MPTKLSVNKIMEFPEPKDKKQVQRYLGLVNTLRHWSNNLNVNLPNIRLLASKDSVWSWNETHQKEFDSVKKMASKVGFLSPYDPEKPIYLKTNGLKLGLGYLLFQPGDEETKKIQGGKT